MSEFNLDAWPEGPEAEERIGRLLETLLWMTWPKRPGFLGMPIELRGELPDGRAGRFVKRKDDWWLTIEGEEETYVDPAHLPSLMVEKGLLPSSVVLVPEIAGHLYLAAIVETEAAHLSWQQAVKTVLDAVPEARQYFKDPEQFDAMVMSVSEPMHFVIATDSMDACIRHGIAAIPLAIAAADAQVNSWANDWGGWTKEEQRMGTAARYSMLGERVGTELAIDEEPILSLRDRILHRNDLIHGNAVAEEHPLEQKGAGRPLVLDARRTCIVVRQSLVLMSYILGQTPPPYLAHCPEAPFEDDESWVNARLRTGSREDSVFPKAGEGSV